MYLRWRHWFWPSSPVVSLQRRQSRSAPAKVSTITHFTTTGGEYQQLYVGTLFPGVVEITGITFFAEYQQQGSISGDYIINFSTSSATTAVGGLSPVYANNIGPDQTQFFSGNVSEVFSFFGAPFTFDPSQGNLLLDIDVLSALGNGPDTALLGSCSGDTNRVFNSGGFGPPLVGYGNCPPNGVGSGGLETEFTFTPVAASEPSGSVISFTGLLVLGATSAGARRAKANGFKTRRKVGA